ncbi:MAG: HNH endonuclease [Pseudomonadota bacterium]
MTSDARNPKRFQLEHTAGVEVSDADILADMRRVATEFGAGSLSSRLFEAKGKYSHTTASERFGSWNAALLAAGLKVRNQVDISDDRLFENLLVLWQHFGRQPRRSELSSPPSVISQTPYNRRFGSWRASLEAFISFANATGADSPATPSGLDTSRRATGREPSLRLRWRVLQRDRFTCCACGASPALTLGIELHVDHIVPWSRGGETILENLQTLCSVCNFGKSNVHG